MCNLLFIFCLKSNGTCRFALFQRFFILNQYIVSLFGSFVATRLCLFLYLLDTTLDRFQVFQLKFIVDDFFVADRIYTSVYVCHVNVVEATEYMDNSVCLTDIGKELVSQSFTFTCTFYQSGDIYDFYGCRNNPLGMYQFCQRIQTFIGNGNYTYIGFNSTEREICRLCFRIRQTVEKCRLTHVR